MRTTFCALAYYAQSLPSTLAEAPLTLNPFTGLSTSLLHSTISSTMEFITIIILLDPTFLILLQCNNYYFSILSLLCPLKAFPKPDTLSRTLVYFVCTRNSLYLCLLSPG